MSPLRGVRARDDEHAAEQSFAVTIAPSAASRLIQFRVSKKAVAVGAVLLSILLLALMAASIFYSHLLAEARSARELRADNILLRRQLARLNTLERQVATLDASRRALLKIVGVEDVPADTTMGPDFQLEMAPGNAAYHPVQPGSMPGDEELGEVRRILSHLPLAGPRTRGFGLVGESGVFHAGVDVAGETGAPIEAAGEGIVSFVGTDETFGLVVVVAHRPGMATMYGHLSQVRVQVGDYVTAGQTIAEVGNTGHSTAPHLHFEVHLDDVAVDPSRLIATWRRTPQADSGEPGAPSN
jgi:murein DD-endopeptidase MepM/ murein hydrolase activator NlpD